METVPARKALSPGIQAVQARLPKAGDGKPRLFLFRDALVRRDPALDQAKKPVSTEDEFDSYVWDLACGRKKGEEPLDKDNHGLDALRYAVAHHDLAASGRFRESDLQATLRRK
jgi:phage terminase large subunit